MSKVDWITWKTNPSDIINPEKIMEKLSDRFQDYHTYMTATVYEGVKHEVEKGGLDKASFDIAGISPANENAIKILNTIDEIKTTMNNLKEEISEQAKEQKKIEKEQLIEAIEEKIKEEEKILENTEKLKARLTEENTLITISEVNDMIDNNKERIRRLAERLEAAKAI